jgi:hypothetical protein
MSQIRPFGEDLFLIENKTRRDNSASSNYGNNGNTDQRNLDSIDVAFMTTRKLTKPANDNKTLKSKM